MKPSKTEKWKSRLSEIEDPIKIKTNRVIDEHEKNCPLFKEYGMCEFASGFKEGIKFITNPNTHS